MSYWSQWFPTACGGKCGGVTTQCQSHSYQNGPSLRLDWRILCGGASFYFVLRANTLAFVSISSGEIKNRGVHTPKTRRIRPEVSLGSRVHAWHTGSWLHPQPSDNIIIELERALKGKCGRQCTFGLLVPIDLAVSLTLKDSARSHIRLLSPWSQFESYEDLK